MFLRFLIAIFALAISASAFGRDLSVGSVKLSMTPPPGFCELNEGQDNYMLTAMRGIFTEKVTLLAMLADCKQLAAFRAGVAKPLQNTITYSTPTVILDVNADSDFVKQACSDMRSNGEKTVADQNPGAKARIEAVFKRAEFGRVQFLGILEEKPDVCFGAALQKYKASNGAAVAQTVIFAITTVRNRLVQIQSYSPYVDSNSISSSLANLKIYYADFVAANKEP